MPHSSAIATILYNLQGLRILRKRKEGATTCHYLCSPRLAIKIVPWVQLAAISVSMTQDAVAKQHSTPSWRALMHWLMSSGSINMESTISVSG